MKTFHHNTTNGLRILIAAAAVCAALASPVRADEAPQVHVKYADLDLGSNAGADVLYERIRRAADAVCGVSDSRHLAEIATAKSCADHAVTQAVATLNGRALGDIHHVKLGAPAAIVVALR